MSKVLAATGSLVIGTLGWWLGARVGPMTGYLTSVVGGGLGIYLGRRLADRLIE